jgi:hypothetical protein
MEKDLNLKITLEQARKWYFESDNVELARLALQAFTQEELIGEHWPEIKTFDDVLEEIGYSKSDFDFHKSNLSKCPNYEHLLALYKIDLIRTALNGQYWKPNFTTGKIYYPQILLFRTYKEVKMWPITHCYLCGRILIESESFYIVGNLCSGYNNEFGSYAFERSNSADHILFSCKSQEVAMHFSKYFYKEIFDVLYAHQLKYKWIE